VQSHWRHCTESVNRASWPVSWAAPAVAIRQPNCSSPSRHRARYCLSTLVVPNCHQPLRAQSRQYDLPLSGTAQAVGNYQGRTPCIKAGSACCHQMCSLVLQCLVASSQQQVWVHRSAVPGNRQALLSGRGEPAVPSVAQRRIVALRHRIDELVA